MADFTLSAPGTTNNPWNPGSIIKPLGNIKSDTNGWRAQTNTVVSPFGHDATYASPIIATATIAATSGADDIFLGALVRTGANAGGMIGVYITGTTVAAGSLSVAGGLTVGTAAASTRTIADVYAVTVSISGGTATITLTKNGSPISLTGNTTTTFATETTLAAGAAFYPFNSNLTYLSQFTGTGVVVVIDPGLLSGRKGGGSGILGPRRPFGQMFRSRGGILVPRHAAA